jgi:hypothetical protein
MLELARISSMARTLRERQSPRISVNDLALYMLSSETAKLGIIRRAKYPQAPPIIRYRDVRIVICSYLSDPLRRVNRLSDAEEVFRQRASDMSQTSLVRDDAKASIEVIGAIQRMANRLAGFEFSPAPPDQGKLSIADVEISVRADMLAKTSVRSRDFYGAAVLRLTQDDAGTETAITRRKDVGLYVATIARMHADQNLTFAGDVGNRACMSIDVQHGEFFQAPDATTRRMQDIENACRFIAAIWESVTP